MLSIKSDVYTKLSLPSYTTFYEISTKVSVYKDGNSIFNFMCRDCYCILIPRIRYSFKTRDLSLPETIETELDVRAKAH